MRLPLVESRGHVITQPGAAPASLPSGPGRAGAALLAALLLSLVHPDQCLVAVRYLWGKAICIYHLQEFVCRIRHGLPDFLVL